MERCKSLLVQHGFSAQLGKQAMQCRSSPYDNYDVLPIFFLSMLPIDRIDIPEQGK
jgi:hypothetical protein